MEALGIMKIGDLVKRTGVNSSGKLGIIVKTEASWDHFFVCWGDYGTFWTPAHCLELVNESR